MRHFAARTMLAIGATLLAGQSVPALAAMQPGLWSFTQQTTGSRPKRSTRCVRPADAADLARFFLPRSGGRTGACELVDNSASGNRVTSRLRCTAGQTSSEVASVINIDTPTHLTITTTLSTMAQGKSSNVGMRGEGKWIGNCR
jgi:Protein of unknown function (DUF3617)